MATGKSTPPIDPTSKSPHSDRTNGQVLAPANGSTPQAHPFAPDNGRYVTKEEYMAVYYEGLDANYEWNNGYLEAKPVASILQSKLHLWFLMLLHYFLKEQNLAEMMILEIGFDMTVLDPDKPGQMKEVIRKPDIGVVRHDNPVTLHEQDRKFKGICDICVESISDSARSEIIRDTVLKKAEYEFAAVKEYYILDPTGEHMVFYTLSPAGTYVEMVPDAAGVIRSTVLPGFQFRVDDLYRRPDFTELALHPVYSGYLLREYQETVERAVSAEAQAIMEAARAEAEAARAETEAARAARAEAEIERLRAELAQARGSGS